MEVSGQLHASADLSAGTVFLEPINLLKPSGNFTYHQV
jgi:hypothetical protein